MKPPMGEPYPREKTLLACALLCFAAAAGAQNLVLNPSAEYVDDGTGMPTNWQVYAGTGGATLRSSIAEYHSGARSAYLTNTSWDGSPGAESADNGIVLCNSDFYGAGGSTACTPDTTYAFMFWYKGHFQAASVVACGWTGIAAGSSGRTPFAVTLTGNAMAPTQTWQRSSGTFRTATNSTRMAVMINVTAVRTAGENIGDIYVDDAHIHARALPSVGIRGAWFWVTNGASVAGHTEITNSIAGMKAAGLNSVFVWMDSLYIAALEHTNTRPYYEAKAGWDSFGELLKEATRQSIQVHLWYSPWREKYTDTGVELIDHPEWVAVDANGSSTNAQHCICPVRPEVREFELNTIINIIDRYPDISGIHLEEPNI
ncbi:MAG: family 10 glycosylhydrolase, partial [Verrucomicrobia bacterium]|nr:family 10 glycosylhydrolase [Verrucomicrobiota bacterium]